MPKSPQQVLSDAVGAGDYGITVKAVDASGNVVGSVVPTGGGKTLLFAKIDTASSGATTLVAAVAAKKVKVVSIAVVVTTAVTVQFLSAATALTGAMAFGATGGIAETGTVSAHLMETAVNEAFRISLGGAVQASGHVAYFLEA